MSFEKIRFRFTEIERGSDTGKDLCVGWPPEVALPWTTSSLGWPTEVASSRFAVCSCDANQVDESRS